MRADALFLIASGLLLAVGLSAAPELKLHDSRLQMTLFAEDPDIVTPIGLILNDRDQLLVLESHTHLPPRDYNGPRRDRVKVFTDTDRDGKPDRLEVFAEGVNEGMNLALSPDGELYVVCAREVLWLRDADRDGKCDSRERVLRVETDNTYPHSCLLGITFSRDGWLYVSRGNNGSISYTIRGTDGSTVSGFGDGGNIVRCRPDGSGLEAFATGFWNPFDIKFDHAGRLLCVDNDPDARGPNRLVHVVRDGDYGYVSRYGGGGNHPYQSWNGELPGTLPFIDGTGEAPSGLIDCRRTSLPVDYRNDILVTVWNENTVTRHATRAQGASLTAIHSVLVSGPKDFRPVALAADSHGDIYMTDWVRVDYPNHGRGRIWKLTTRPGAERLKPRGYFASPVPNPSQHSLDALAAIRDPNRYPQLEQGLQSDDPFVRHAAVTALKRPGLRPHAIEATRNASPRVRLGGLLALMGAGEVEAPPMVRRLLSDPDADVRRMALVWAGRQGLTGLRGELERAIDGDDVSSTLFETYLATIENLDPALARRVGRSGKASRIRGTLPAGLLESIVKDEARSATVRSLALRRLPDTMSPATRALLWRMTESSEPRLQLEAIRSLALRPDASTAPGLKRIALDRGYHPDVRAEALSGLAWQHDVALAELTPLLRDRETTIQVEAVRLLRSASEESVARALRARYEELLHEKGREPVLRQLEWYYQMLGMELERPPGPRPESPEAWKRELAEGGDIRAGERLYFAPLTSCSKCHLLESRGGRLGPDLSNIGQSVTRDQIIHSILRPSDQFAPQWQAWTVETTSGELHQGLQLDHKSEGAIELFTTAGRTVHFPGGEIESYAASTRSLMPDGLEAGLTVEDFRNLVAFLESLK